jgi:hypothetical protein
MIEIPETEEELAAARAEAKAAGLNEWDRPEKIAAYIDANIIPIVARTVMEQLGIQVLVVHKRRLPNAPQAIVQARRRLCAAAARAVRVGKARREDGALGSRMFTVEKPEPAAERKRAEHRAVL